MSKKKEVELFEQWVKETTSKIKDPSKRAAFESLTSSMDDESLEVFRGAHRGEDYYRRLNDLNDSKEELRKAQEKFEADQSKFISDRDAILNWYETEAPRNERLVKEKANVEKELRMARAQLKELGLTDAVEDVNTALERSNMNKDATHNEVEQLREQLQRTQTLIDKGLPRLLSDVLGVSHRIAKENWGVSPDKVLEHSLTKGVTIDQAFQELTRDEAATRAEKEREELVKKAREEGMREALSKIPSPDRARPSGPSVVDALRSGGTPTGGGVDAATRAYLEQAGVGGANG